MDSNFCHSPHHLTPRAARSTNVSRTPRATPVGTSQMFTNAQGNEFNNTTFVTNINAAAGPSLDEFDGGPHLAPNAGWNVSASNDIIALLLSHSAPAGLLDAKERFDAPKCDEGTRTSMICGMKKFVQDGGATSSPALYWLHGPAGVGKSALCQSLALLLKSEGNLAASFFFSRTSPGRNNGNRLIVTLAYQLAVNFPVLQPFISKIIQANPAILAASNAAQMQNLIIDPINEWKKKCVSGVWQRARRILNIKKNLHPRLILVDGLDECNGSDVQTNLITCIASAVQQLSLPFRFVIASRPESHILSTFELDATFQCLDATRFTKKDLGNDEDADEQITTFLLKEFAEIRRTHPIREYLPNPWPLPGQIAQLVAKSSKGFIYPATVIRYIKMLHLRPDECLDRILGLSEIPIHDKPFATLDVLYHHIFKSVPGVNKAAIREIFHFLVLPYEVIGGAPIAQPCLIENYYNYKPGHVRHVLRDLLCLVSYTDDSAPIKVLHASLSDFLLDQSRSGCLYINIADAHATVAGIFPWLPNDHRCRTLPILPNSRHIQVLKHLMHAHTVNTPLHRRLVDMDFSSAYVQHCNAWLGAWRNNYRIMPPFAESATFITAYYLILATKGVQITDIRTNIMKMKTLLIQEFPLAASFYVVSNELVPAMIPPLWELDTAYNPEMQSFYGGIFAYEVSPDIHHEIFELYLLMMAPSFGHGSTLTDRLDFRNTCLQPRAQQLMAYSYICHSLLEFLAGGPIGYISSFPDLAIKLLQVCLPYADYLVSVIALLDNVIMRKYSNLGPYLRRLPEMSPNIVDYLERVYPVAPVGSQHELLELCSIWKQYAEDNEALHPRYLAIRAKEDDDDW